MICHQNDTSLSVSINNNCTCIHINYIPSQSTKSRITACNIEQVYIPKHKVSQDMI